MKKTRIMMTAMVSILVLFAFTGCGPEDSTDTSSSVDSISATETASEKEVMVKQENVDASDEEIVEEVVQQIVVDENADGEENGFSQEIVIP